MCLCVFLRNLGEYYVLLLVEPISGKNVSPSDKQLWLFFEKRLSKLQRNRSVKSYRSFAILKFLRFLLMSAENNETLTFVSLALSIVITSCFSAIYGVLSINSQVQVPVAYPE